MLTEDHSQVLVGRQIGAYKILSLLGTGGMGSACGLRHPRTQCAAGSWGWGPTSTDKRHNLALCR